MDNQETAPPAGGPSTMIDEDRIARVARALCAADGNDPDGTVISKAIEDVPTEFGTLAEMPAWTSCAGEARRIIAAMVALGWWNSSASPSHRASPTGSRKLATAPWHHGAMAPPHDGALVRAHSGATMRRCDGAVVR